MKHHLPLIKAAASGRGTTTRVNGLEIAFMDRADGSILAAVAGSDLDGWGRDWLRSARCLPDDYLNRGNCHAGYNAGGRSLWNSYNVRERIHGKPVECCGYSLGGPVAEALALRIHDNGGTVLGVTTYAAPSWLAPGFEWPSEIPRVRYVCGLDPIPRLFWPWYQHQTPATRLPSPNGALIGPLLDHRLRSYEAAF